MWAVTGMVLPVSTGYQRRPPEPGKIDSNQPWLIRGPPYSQCNGEVQVVMRLLLIIKGVPYGLSTADVCLPLLCAPYGLSTAEVGLPLLCAPYGLSTADRLAD